MRFGHSSLALPLLALGASLFACADPTSTLPARSGGSASLASGGGGGGNPTVTSALPNAAPRGTTLDVQINGSGFDKGTRASFLLHGVDDPRVQVNSTRYVKSTQLVANVTMTADAEPDRYDIAVVTALDKKGIGTERFEVQIQSEALVDGDHVFGVNSTGDAVGRGPSSVPCVSQVAPLLWHADGSKVALPLGGFCGGNALAINASGTILGSLSGGPSNSRGLWMSVGGSYVLQEIAPAPDGYRPLTGSGMNDANEIVGWGQGGARMFWWSEATGWLPMQVPAGATLCQAFSAINNRGEIAATCTVSGVSQAFYWSDHSAAPMQLPRPAGIANATPRDINESGVIVGGGGGKALRWTPNGAGSFTVDVLNDAGSGGFAYSIADDGTVAGTISRSGSAGPLPAYWPQGGSYRTLALSNSGRWGEAATVVSGVGGLVIGGHEANQTARRWRNMP